MWLKLRIPINYEDEIHFYIPNHVHYKVIYLFRNPGTSLPFAE